MATSSTVNTQIIVNFEDKFTESACKAMETYKRCMEDVLQLQVKSEDSARSLDLFSQGFERLEKDAEKLNTFLLALGIPAFIIALRALPAPINIAIGSLVALYAAWKVGEELAEWRVGGEPIEKYVEGVQESLEQLGNSQTLQFPTIPEDGVQSLESTKTCLEQIQNMQDIFITVNLVDSATEEAKRIREEIEKTFSQDITQRVTIAEQTVRSISGPGPGSRAPDPFFYGGPEFLTSSKNLTGFGDKVDTSTKVKVPGFSSGIDRVPRDMLAMIHKDEAVLPKNQADDFRQGNSSGMTIQNLNFSFNVPNGLKLEREEFRNLAFQMRDELKRLDGRMN